MGKTGISDIVEIGAVMYDQMMPVTRKEIEENTVLKIVFLS